MRWREAQAEFARAVRDSEHAVPDAVGPRAPTAPERRFNVYRNNSAVSLTEAICDSFPVASELVGAEFFQAMARAYVSRHVPTSPVLLRYGGSFPDFVEHFEPAAALPFLADVTRIEWAWIEAYHAADQASIGADALSTIPPDALAGVRLRLHPSVRLIRSEWSAISIWSAHQLAEPAARQEALATITPQAEAGLIVRPDMTVDVRRVDGVVLAFLEALAADVPLGAAAEVLADADMAEFGNLLGYVFSTGAIVAIEQL